MNGVGSVGKSTTIQALQTITRAPFLHVAMDDFLDRLPARMRGDPDGWTFETLSMEGQPAIAIRTGAVFARAMRGMRRAIASLADAGNNLLVDEVMMGDGEALEYRGLLSAHDVSFVGLFAPLDVLEARELARGDREIGLARWQYDRVHRDVAYDLELDTARATPHENATRIREAFDL